MASRLELQSKLEELLGSRNVYYNPPTNLRMEYDCIRFHLSTVQSEYANDVKYKNMKRYELMVIARTTDPEIVDRLLELPYCSMGTAYKADNLNHYPFTLYW